MTQEELERQKVKEEWLREETRASRKLAVNQIQWGVTVLAAVEVKLYDIRGDIIEHLGHPLPLVPRWILGTSLMLILAIIFTSYLSRTVRYHQQHIGELRKLDPSYSGIDEKAPKGWLLLPHRILNHLHYFLFFLFPALDVLVWFVVREPATPVFQSHKSMIVFFFAVVVVVLAAVTAELILRANTKRTSPSV